MRNIQNLILIYKKKLVIISFVILSLLAVYFSLSKSDSYYETVDENTNKSLSMIENKSDKIKVDIKGAVTSPGVYELDAGSRVVDAVKLAGGFLANAYTKYINLSKLLEDESVIIINTYEEIEKLKEENYDFPCDPISISCLTRPYLISTELKENVTKEKNSEKSNKFVNINTASKEELTKLDGIGESKALKIIEYREANGSFKNISEIMNVSGIGKTMYEKIKDNITV